MSCISSKCSRRISHRKHCWIYWKRGRYIYLPEYSTRWTRV
ncbi:hypothetical protein GQ600_3783 [Phytophthora cactorum]|nr:hypothetical protein GQ600_3783 [Phytophthora cactorum]